MAEKIIYTKFSNDRTDKYCIATDIIQNEEKRYVRKRALNKETEAHIKNLKVSQERLNMLYSDSRFNVNRILDAQDNYVDFEYISGISYDKLLDEYVNKNDFIGVLAGMNLFFDELSKCKTIPFGQSDISKHYFGDVKELLGVAALPYADVDLIFQNVIVDKNENWHIIDYEWSFDCQIPLRYLQYRSIMLYVYGLSKRHALIEKDVFKQFGFTDNELVVYERMEQHFQKAIKGEHDQLGDFYHVMGMPALSVDSLVRDKKKHMIEVFVDRGKGFQENEKMYFDCFPVKVEVDENVKAIRIDPMSTEGVVIVRSIQDNKKRDFEYTVNGISEDNKLYWFEHDDPSVVVKNIYIDSAYFLIDMDILPFEHGNETIYNVMKSEISTLKSEINVLKTENQSLTCDIQAKTEEITQRDEMIVRLEQDIGSIHQSFSWKITAPMRILALSGYRLIRKFKLTALCYDGFRYLLKFGIRSTARRIKELYGKSSAVLDERDFDLPLDVVEQQRAMKFEFEPVISILVPLYNTPEIFLKEMIDSVCNQTYGKWELCLADGSDKDHLTVEKTCREYYKKDNRIKYKKLDKNLGISENTNACIELATGDYIGLFDHDDLLTQDALFEVVKRINEKENVDVVYTDEDKLLYNAKDGSAKYVEPHCKSDFNLDLLRTNNYICHFFVVNRAIVDKVGGFRSAYDGSQDYDFILRCVENAKSVEHIAKILYHWRIHANSTAANPQSKMYCYEAGKHAIEAHLERMQIKADVEMTEHLGFYRVKYPVKEKPLVSIIIPNKDEKQTLEKCIHSIEQKTTYDNYEIIIVENNSVTTEIFEYYNELSKDRRIKVIHWEDEFNYSKINNYGVSQSNGEYIILLNNDVEVISDCWMEELLANCQREEVGIVGAKLLYPDNTVQHAGVIIGLGGIAGHAFVGLDGNHPGYFGRAFVQQDLSAVTAACLMVSRRVYNEVNGLEEQLKVAFNDVDFCLKVRNSGYLVVMNPNVKLYHYESKSRGAEDTPEKHARFASEVNYMAEHWRDILESGDPYYNKNLTLVRGDFSIKGKDEVSPSYI